MTIKRIKRPRDPALLAKLIVDIATGQIYDKQDDGKNPAAVQRGRMGGLKGGQVRATRMTSAQRGDSSRKAAKARWSKRQPN